MMFEYQKVKYKKVECQKVEIQKSRINKVSDATYISDVVFFMIWHLAEKGQPVLYNSAFWGDF